MIYKRLLGLIGLDRPGSANVLLYLFSCLVPLIQAVFDSSPFTSFILLPFGFWYSSHSSHPPLLCFLLVIVPVIFHLPPSLPFSYSHLIPVLHLCPFSSLTHFSLNADREPAILASCLSFRTGKFQALSLWHCFLQREVTNSNTTRSFARADNLEYHRSFWVMIITKLTTPVSE